MSKPPSPAPLHLRMGATAINVAAGLTVLAPFYAVAWLIATVRRRWLMFRHPDTEPPSRDVLIGAVLKPPQRAMLTLEPVHAALHRHDRSIGYQALGLRTVGASNGGPPGRLGALRVLVLETASYPAYRRIVDSRWAVTFETLRRAQIEVSAELGPAASQKDVNAAVAARVGGLRPFLPPCGCMLLMAGIRLLPILLTSRRQKLGQILADTMTVRDHPTA